MAQYEQFNYLPPLCEALTKEGKCSITCVYVFNVYFKDSTLPFNPHLCSEADLSLLRSKGHLIIRMLQLKIGHDLLVQVCDLSLNVTIYLRVLISLVRRKH